MGPTVLIILIAIGLTAFSLLIRYWINRGVDKAADSIRNSRVRKKNEAAGSVYQAPTRSALSTGSASAVSAGSAAPALRDGVVYLREWYPNYRPARIRHGLQMMQQTAAETASLPNKPTETAPSASASAYNTAESTVESLQRQTVQPKKCFADNRCCICGDALSEQYAVLFIASDGSEARVDRKCFAVLRNLGTSEDPEVVLRAKRYVEQKRMNGYEQELQAYLDKYIRSADAFLSQTDTGN